MTIGKIFIARNIVDDDPELSQYVGAGFAETEYTWSSEYEITNDLPSAPLEKVKPYMNFCEVCVDFVRIDSAGAA